MENINNTLITKQNNIFWKIEYMKDADMLGFTGYYSRIDPWRPDKAKDYNLYTTIQTDAKKMFDIFDDFLKGGPDNEIEFPGSYGCMSSIKIKNKKTKHITKITTRDQSIDEKDGQLFMLSYDHIMTTKILLSRIVALEDQVAKTEDHMAKTNDIFALLTDFIDSTKLENLPKIKEIIKK